MRIAPQPGWPTWLALRATYRLEPDALTVAVEARNIGDRACPFGLGMHPYLSGTTGTVGDLVVTFDAARVAVLDERGLPSGWQPVAGELDFHAGRRVGPSVLDTCFELGGAPLSVRVDGVHNGSVELWGDAAFGYVQLFTGDTDPDPTRRRTALAVEPMSCPPDAFRSGTAVARLDPGGTWHGTWGLRW